MQNRFAGKVAIVTGGASGIGEAIAARITAEGGQVVVFDLAARSQSDKTVFFTVDVGVEDTARQAIDNVAARYGRLDILVNSAGIVGPTSTRISDYNSEDFQRVLQVNLFGSFYMVKHILPHMLAHNYGRILLLSSMAGKDGNPGMVGYSTSKAGVIGLVKAVGKEYAETGITVNAIAPAVIRTPMNERTAPEQLKYLVERIPMKRLGTVEEAAALACWIVSDEASFTTGFVYDLSGGRATY